MATGRLTSGYRPPGPRPQRVFAGPDRALLPGAVQGSLAQSRVHPGGSPGLDVHAGLRRAGAGVTAIPALPAAARVPPLTGQVAVDISTPPETLTQ